MLQLTSKSFESVFFSNYAKIISNGFFSLSFKVFITGKCRHVQFSAQIMTSNRHCNLICCEHIARRLYILVLYDRIRRLIFCNLWLEAHFLSQSVKKLKFVQHRILLSTTDSFLFLSNLFFLVRYVCGLYLKLLDYFTAAIRCFCCWAFVSGEAFSSRLFFFLITNCVGWRSFDALLCL